MIHPDTELQFIREEIGYGIVATRLIPRGTITWALDAMDQILRPAQARRLPQPLQAQFQKYSFRNAEGRYILCWDHARFVNHSCRANCIETGFDCEIAVRDILPGEQLTDDYASLQIEESFVCRCGEPDCRDVVRPGDEVALHGRWESLAQGALPLLTRVTQPLLPLVERQRELIRAAESADDRVSCNLALALPAS